MLCTWCSVHNTGESNSPKLHVVEKQSQSTWADLNTEPIVARSQCTRLAYLSSILLCTECATDLNWMLCTECCRRQSKSMCLTWTRCCVVYWANSCQCAKQIVKKIRELTWADALNVAEAKAMASELNWTIRCAKHRCRCTDALNVAWYQNQR